MKTETLHTESKELVSKLEEFEHKYDMTTPAFLKQWRQGVLPETAEYREWSMLYSAYQLTSNGTVQPA